MSMISSDGRELRADINVTPLIDVLLVLLIIFMVIQPMAVCGFDTLLPQSPKSFDHSDPSQTIVVQLFANREHGVTYKINEALLDKREVERKLSEIFAARRDKALFIQGDANLEFSPIAEVIGYADQAGVDDIGIITPRTTNPSLH